ncbi:hypothetical protein BJX70DRAFT_396691 [Aspergillus crustosus]
MHVHLATIFAELLAAATVVYGSAAHNNSAVYKALYAVHSSSTPVFQNVSGQSANPLVRVLQNPTKDVRSIIKRDELPIGTCAPGVPCVNGACCSKEGICGFSPDECGKDTCISNCDAKAECGQYALPESATCPLNVCCSKYGFCGTTEDFCGTGCQKGYGGCGSVEEPSCGGQNMARTVGYYEGWSSTRKCDKRLPSDIDIVSLTHINFAFAFFHPTTFQVLPMSANDEALYPQFTGLKSKKPSLKTWIAVGGWSFNDATNSPNTQTAFSDMASSAANRRTFISSLLHFMQAWGFDGVDLDWEYPGADDRGGIPEDTANFVELLRDMKNAFQGRYGISVTLPASYWYLRWFDLEGMQDHIDFFNIMTYDIHGVWDASNKNTGPYIRPHTNITEIKLGLDLLWRNNVDPFHVNFGLGWYGRSFTLKDPTCNQPDCVFSYGGKPGECTNSAGTLSIAEIQRIITKNNLTPTIDAEAAVKWISWDSDQWVSYDDGETIQMKIAEANKLCLGGVLIWAVDLDGLDHTSSNDMLGIGPANGVSPVDAERYREQRESIDRAATIANSCYWTFCGNLCTKGYTEQAYARGVVPNIEGDASCTDDTVRILCCAPGTTTGTCSWNGWNGVGMACSTEYCPSGKELIAMNTNSYVADTDRAMNNNLTYNGGAQSYCCSGFVPSQISNTNSLSLLGDYRIVDEGQTGLSLRIPEYEDVSKLACGSSVLGGIGALFNDVVSRLGQGAAGIGQQKPKEPTKQGTPNKPKGKFGRYDQVVYKKGTKDCQVTYTCQYGIGFDEICDNIRWVIKVSFDGSNIYHKATRRIEKTFADKWRHERVEGFTSLAARPPGWPTGRDTQPRCNVEEFPFASLQEAENDNFQILRYVSEKANSAHSQDWGSWINAEYMPCQRLRAQRKIEPKEPPITMTWSPFEDGDNRIKANQEAPHNKAPLFIEAYGFNSQGDVECFRELSPPVFSSTSSDLDFSLQATYTYPADDGATVTKTLTDYGFRAHPRDPIKRDVTPGVRNQDLPLSAIQEVEEAEAVSKVGQAFLEHQSGAVPAATDAAEFSIAFETDAAAGSSWQVWSEQHMPVETEVAEAEGTNDSRMMRRRRQHLQEHQQGHAHGHGH